MMPNVQTPNLLMWIKGSFKNKQVKGAFIFYQASALLFNTKNQATILNSSFLQLITYPQNFQENSTPDIRSISQLIKKHIK